MFICQDHFAYLAVFKFMVAGYILSNPGVSGSLRFLKCLTWLQFRRKNTEFGYQNSERPVIGKIFDASQNNFLLLYVVG